MKKVSLILSSSKRSETYYKEIKKNSNILISKLIFYGNKPKYFRREDLKKIYFFPEKFISSRISRFILKLKEKEFIVSPMAGEIIKFKNLLSKKRLVHFHPGNLPYFKGSTVLYYTLLEKKKIFCSCFILSKEVDTGKILLKEKFKTPKFQNEWDIEQYDNYLRSKTMIKYIKSSVKKDKKKIKDNYINYFIIHPVLRKIVVNKKILEFIKKIPNKMYNL